MNRDEHQARRRGSIGTASWIAGSPLRLAPQPAPSDGWGAPDRDFALPLVGRTLERAALGAALEMADRGVATAVLVRGAAGTGKTRLAQEAIAMARGAGFACAWGAGFAEGGLPPMWPWHSIQAQLGHADVVEQSAAFSDGELTDHVNSAHVNSAHVNSARFGHFRSVVDQLAKSTTTTPTLIVIDDAHTLDVGALLLVRFVVRSLRASRLVVLVTAAEDAASDEAVATVLDEIGRDGNIVRLGALTNDNIEQLLRSVGAAADETHIRDVAEVTGGSPMLLHELLMAENELGDVGTISMQSICDLRVRGLSAEQRAALAALALLGRCSSNEWISAVSHLDVATVDAILADAVQSGLVTDDGGDHKIRHELVARTIVASFSKAEVALFHRRIADLPDPQGNPTVARLLSAARHQLASAALQPTRENIELAAAASRAASARLLRSMAFETASDTTRQAVALYDDAEMVAPVGLLLDTARSELAAGRLVEARRWFRRAAEIADDPTDLAVAAIGLGGMWVNEHRNGSEHAAFMSLLHRAAAEVGDDHPLLAARLAVRIAAEDVYSGSGTHADMRRAVEQARATGDSYVVAEALSLFLHTMLGPAHAHDRRAAADEMTRAAAASGDGLLVLLAAMWRVIDLVLTGDPRGERALNELREQADALQVAAVLFVVKALDVMRLIRQGQLTDALRDAENCFEIGHRLGDADATAYLGGQLLTIRWLQQRSEDMLPLARQVASAPTLVDGDVSFTAAVALLTAMAGQVDEASVTLHRVLSGSKLSVEFSSTWLISMFMAAETAALLADADAARMIHSAVEPFAELPIMASLGIVCVGSAERTLGVAARTMGRLDLAVDHLERGLTENHRLGNRVMAAITQGELGEVLLERGNPGDELHGHHLVEGAIATLRELGLVERAALLEVAIAGPRGAAAAPAGRVVQRGSVWELHFGDQVIQLTDTVGAQRLIHLLEHPFVDVPASDLVGGVAPAAVQDLVDSKALRAYRDRIAELRSDIDDAESDHDLARAERLRDELDAILSHLSSTEGLSGHSRRFVNAHERARIAVRKSLTRVLDEVSAQAPQFAIALADSLRTGSLCRFHPQTPFPAIWHRVSTSAHEA